MADQAQDGKLQVRLVTPDRELVDTAADAVELPGRTGYLEVLYGAAESRDHPGGKRREAGAD